MKILCGSATLLVLVKMPQVVLFQATHGGRAGTALVTRRAVHKKNNPESEAGEQEVSGQHVQHVSIKITRCYFFALCVLQLGNDDGKNLKVKAEDA